MHPKRTNSADARVENLGRSTLLQKNAFMLNSSLSCFTSRTYQTAVQYCRAYFICYSGIERIFWPHDIFIFDITGNDSNGSTFGLSIVYCVFFIPLSYLCWFRPAYKVLCTYCTQKTEQYCTVYSNVLCSVRYWSYYVTCIFDLLKTRRNTNRYYKILLNLIKMY